MGCALDHPFPLPGVRPPVVDTHCHFDSEDDSGGLLQEAAAADVRVIAVGGNMALNATAEASGTFFAQGYDWSCDGPASALRIKPGMVAVGELGFDFHFMRGPKVATRQCANVESQAEFARANSLPIIVHIREAEALACDTLRRLALPRAGVIHSYTGDCSIARVLLDLGYFLSFSGIVTFRNAAALREVAKFVPDDRILVETDAPYLAPVPFRGRRNRPVYVRATADFLAALRGVPCETFVALTTANAETLFDGLLEQTPPRWSDDDVQLSGFR